MTPRHWGSALAVAGLLLLAGKALLSPTPDNLEDFLVRLEREGPGLAEAPTLAGRSPQLGGGVIARYDAENDTTFAVFGCSHFYCRAAVPIEGDARPALAAERFLLAPAGEGPVALAPLAPAIPLDAGGLPMSVNRTVTVPYRLASPWPPMLAVDAGLVLLLAGAALLLPGFLPPTALRASAWGGVGTLFGHALAGAFWFFSWVASAFFALAGASALVGLAWSYARGRPRSGWLALALFAAGFLAAASLLAAYHPSAPEV